MSNPKRYRPFLNQQGGRYIPSMDCPSMKEDDRGEWVSLVDYKHLKAEVERLTKAGDALALSVEWRNVVVNNPLLANMEIISNCVCNLHNFDSDIKAWQAAKEGKQS